MSRIVSLDYETFYDTKAGYGIRQQGMWGYCQDPRFDPYLIAVSDGSDHWAGQPKDFNWDALDGATLLSHNAGFDSRVYKRMVELNMAPQVNFKDWLCTANMSAYLCNRRDLARACEYLLGVQVDKSVRGAADGKGWKELTAEDDGKSMLAYARDDAKLCWDLFDKHGHKWPERERALSALTIEQGHRGVQIDAKKLIEFLTCAEKMRLQAEFDLPWMKEGKKPTSPKAVAEECRRVGIPCPPVKSRDGEDAYDEWANAYTKKYAWVKAYTDYRVINKFIETLRTIKERLMPSDAFPFDLLYFGAHTGRWSGSGGFNMQNMRRQPLFCDDEGQLVTDPDKLQEIAKSKTQPNWVSAALDIRSLFIARPGKKLIVSDLSQIEPRVLAWTAEDKVMLEMLAEGQSPYEAHARATMGWKGGSMKKEDPSRYLLAKARVLGLGYGCGWEKFITVAYMMAGLDLTADDPEFIQAVDREGNPCVGRDGQPIMTSGRGHTSKKIVADYRENNPLITALWKEIDTAFRDSEGEDFEMTLPSGRVLRYPDVRRERKAVIDPVTRKVVHKWAFTALAFNNTRNTVMRQTFYGGLLTENWVQAFARDIFGEHLLALNSTDGMTPLWSVHDEAIVECDLSISAKDVQDVMSKTPDWAPGLPISAEAEEVPCYKK